MKKLNIIIASFWIILLAVALITMPNISNVVSEKGKITLPDNISSSIASNIKKESNENQDITQISAVFYKENGLSDEDKLKIKEKIDNLKNNKDYNFSSIVTADDSEATKKQLISEDNTTELVIVNINNDNLIEKTNNLSEDIQIDNISTYLTGNQILQDQFSLTTEEGIKKTELISCIFIVIILIIIFRTPIIPAISLLTVGASLIISLNIIMNLSIYYNFPLSNFTQVFLVVVLFGIGTDYNILLYEKFKEELADTSSKIIAAKNATKTAGKTIIYSGMAVFVGFLVLSLSNFIIYKSATGVAIGVIILVINLITVNFLFMTLLGDKIFWHSKKIKKEHDSKLWENLSKLSTTKSYLILIIIAIVISPFIYSGMNRTLNFNDADELSNSNFAKNGYTIIQNHFAKGFSAPVTIFIKSDDVINTQENLNEIDKLTDYLSKKNEIYSVMSVTRPTGEKINELYLNNQISSLSDGLSQAKNGLNTINSGIQIANKEIENKNINEKIKDVNTLANAMSTLDENYIQFNSSISTYISSINLITKKSLDIISNPEIDENLANITQTLSELNKKSEIIDNNIEEISNVVNSSKNNGNNDELIILITELQKNIIAFNNIKNEFIKEATFLNQHSNNIKSNIKYFYDSGEELKTASNNINIAISQINSGTVELNKEAGNINNQVTSMQNNLTTVSDGLTKIETGIYDSNTYLSELSSSFLKNTLFVPNSVLNSNQLDESYNLYLSKDKKITQINIILNDDPTTLKSANLIKSIETEIKDKIKGTSLENSTVTIGGQTSQINDLENLTNSDFLRTAIIMIVGISIILIIITNSLIIPISIIGTLIISYFVSLSITELIAKYFLGNFALAWNAPFFIFIMIIALGVDYSIFYIIRYKDTIKYQNFNPVNSILYSSKKIGSIVISAVIILGGTFAALIPSGVTTLIHVALGVIVELLLLLILLPLIISATIKLSYK